jgi:hypothetical protein
VHAAALTNEPLTECDQQARLRLEFRITRQAPAAERRTHDTVAELSAQDEVGIGL